MCLCCTFSYFNRLQFNKVNINDPTQTNKSLWRKGQAGFMRSWAEEEIKVWFKTVEPQHYIDLQNKSDKDNHNCHFYDKELHICVIVAERHPQHMPWVLTDGTISLFKVRSVRQLMICIPSKNSTVVSLFSLLVLMSILVTKSSSYTS